MADNWDWKFLDHSWIGDPKYSFIAIMIVAAWGATGYLMIIYMAALQGVPANLKEAASIDGADSWQNFWKIVFPLLKPINATQLVLNTVYVWNDYNTAVVLLRDKASRTLPLAQIVYFNENTAELNLAFAFFIMAMIPILILYLCMQKYIVSGITAGAVKG